MPSKMQVAKWWQVCSPVSHGSEHNSLDVISKMTVKTNRLQTVNWNDRKLSSWNIHISFYSQVSVHTQTHDWRRVWLAKSFERRRNLSVGGPWNKSTSQWACGTEKTFCFPLCQGYSCRTINSKSGRQTQTWIENTGLPILGWTWWCLWSI